MDTQEILMQFKNGEMSLEEAEAYLKRQPFEDMGYAKLDSHRKLRSGFAEVIFCSGKADAHLKEIFRHLYEEEGEVLGTRASLSQYELIKKEFPQVQYDEISRILKIEERREEEDWQDCRVHGRYGGYSRGGGSGADGGIFRLKCGPYL